MLKDKYGRPLLSMRASLTSKCNYKCFFCHREGANGDEDEISPEEWKRIFEAASSLGIKGIKFTGGEPLLYEGLGEVLKYASEGFSEISMTTNGYFLEERLGVLREYEVRVNLSLHSLRKDRYAKITGVDGLEKVLRGLEKAIGELDLKINFLALRGVNVDEIWDVVDFCKERGLKLQLIEYERLLGKGDYYYPLEDVEKELSRRALAIKVRRQHGKKVYYLPNEVEVLRTWRNPKMCQMCTRIRVLSNGEAIPCIFRSKERINLLKDPVKGIIRVNEIRRPYWR